MTTNPNSNLPTKREKGQKSLLDSRIGKLGKDGSSPFSDLSQQLRQPQLV